MTEVTEVTDITLRHLAEPRRERRLAAVGLADVERERAPALHRGDGLGARRLEQLLDLRPLLVVRGQREPRRVDDQALDREERLQLAVLRAVEEDRRLLLLVDQPRDDLGDLRARAFVRRLSVCESV